ncbi:MAG: DUF1028 domain-containing protein [Bacteroidetes bacterium]|nr:DUF1028 domain-containing protein [Bacteroidota bacterium]
MKKIILFAALIALGYGARAQGFSIIAVDPSTGEFGSAGGLCKIGSQFRSDIIPGVGAVNSQGIFNQIPNCNLQHGIYYMGLGHAPQAVIDSMIAHDSCGIGDETNRQHMVIDMDSSNVPRMAVYTGVNVSNFTGDTSGYNFLIAGTRLLGQSIIDSMYYNFVNTGGELACRLMAALQGAKVSGADNLCVSNNVSCLSVYIKVAKPNDPSNNFYIDEVIYSTNTEPIDDLQTVIDALVSGCPVVSRQDLPREVIEVNIYPNPFISHTTFEINAPVLIENGNVYLELYDIFGQKLRVVRVTSNIVDMQRGNLSSGLYFYKIVNDGMKISSGKVQIH